MKKCELPVGKLLTCRELKSRELNKSASKTRSNSCCAASVVSPRVPSLTARLASRCRACRAALSARRASRRSSRESSRDPGPVFSMVRACSSQNLEKRVSVVEWGCWVGLARVCFVVPVQEEQEPREFTILQSHPRLVGLRERNPEGRKGL